MAENKLKLLSGRVKKVPSTEADSNRYNWLNLQNAEPDLGVPTSNGSFFVSTVDGTRSWTDTITLTNDGINVDGLTETTDLTATDVANIANLVVSQLANLGAIGNVKISGGTEGQVIATDGSGNLSFADAGSGGDGQVPTLIPEDETYTVLENKQVLFNLPIDVQGDLEVNGVLIQVD